MENTDLTNSIIEAINNILGNIFSSVDNGIYEILDKITFINPQIMEQENLTELSQL